MKKYKNIKKLLFLFVIIFMVGNVGFYLLERAKWVYPAQPYPDAKEYLVLANMLLVYGTTLTKLPFVDERSLVVKPIIYLQDRFVNEWKKRVPKDDAEHYLDWYIFRLRTYIVPNIGLIILYAKQIYSFDEVKKFMEKTWKTIEATRSYPAKDKEFNEIRYAAFQTLSTIYAYNFAAYWIKNPDSHTLYVASQSFIDREEMFQDSDKFQRLMTLYQWIKEMDKFYKERYPKIYYKMKNDYTSGYWENTRMYDLLENLISYLIATDRYRNINFCDDTEGYLADYFSSKEWLLEHREFYEKQGFSFKSVLSSNLDERIAQICPKHNLGKELGNTGSSDNL